MFVVCMRRFAMSLTCIHVGSMIVVVVMVEVIIFVLVVTAIVVTTSTSHESADVSHQRMRLQVLLDVTQEIQALAREIPLVAVFTTLFVKLPPVPSDNGGRHVRLLHDDA